MNYIHSLEKNSKKHICPSCQKKRYVRFINNETNEYLDYNYGRCDRETSCGYFNKPTKNDTITDNQSSRLIKKIPISRFDKSIANASLQKYDTNKLFLFLSNYFDRDLVKQTFKSYYAGTSKKWNGSTVFWLVDNNNNFRDGKIMLYNQNNGKRVRLPFNKITWTHKVMKLENFNLGQCLFGLHLVNEKTKTIAIVESEKTALTMKLFLPEHTWVSTGNKQNLKEELLNSIKDKTIVLYPDKGEYNDWNKKCDKFIKKGFDIRCSKFVENSEGKQGTDLADIFFSIENNTPTNIKPSKTEELANKLYSKNPAIKNLIETFGLTDEGGNIITLN